jgi:hypothetical protein
MDPSPESAEWAIVWTLRRHAKRAAELDVAPEIAKDILDALKKSNWRLIKVPPDLSAPGSSGDVHQAFLRSRRTERDAFDELLAALLRVWDLDQ